MFRVLFSAYPEVDFLEALTSPFPDKWEPLHIPQNMPSSGHDRISCELDELISRLASVQTLLDLISRWFDGFVASRMVRSPDSLTPCFI